MGSASVRKATIFNSPVTIQLRYSNGHGNAAFVPEEAVNTSMTACCWHPCQQHVLQKHPLAANPAGHPRGASKILQNPIRVSQVVYVMASVLHSCTLPDGLSRPRQPRLRRHSNGFSHRSRTPERTPGCKPRAWLYRLPEHRRSGSCPRLDHSIALPRMRLRQYRRRPMVLLCRRLRDRSRPRRKRLR